MEAGANPPILVGVDLLAARTRDERRLQSVNERFMRRSRRSEDDGVRNARETVALFLRRPLIGKMRVVGRDMADRGEDVALVLLIFAVVLRQLELVARQEARAVTVPFDAVIVSLFFLHP